jgi:hypothetical protein
LAAAIRTVLTDHEAAVILAWQAAERSLDFRINQTARGIEEVYRRLLEKGRRSGKARGGGGDSQRGDGTLRRGATYFLSLRLTADILGTIVLSGEAADLSSTAYGMITDLFRLRDAW